MYLLTPRALDTKRLTRSANSKRQMCFDARMFDYLVRLHGEHLVQTVSLVIIFHLAGAGLLITGFPTTFSY